MLKIAYQKGVAPIDQVLVGKIVAINPGTGKLPGAGLIEYVLEGEVRHFAFYFSQLMKIRAGVEAPYFTDERSTDRVHRGDIAVFRVDKHSTGNQKSSLGARAVTSIPEKWKYGMKAKVVGLGHYWEQSQDIILRRKMFRVYKDIGEEGQKWKEVFVGTMMQMEQHRNLWSVTDNFRFQMKDPDGKWQEIKDPRPGFLAKFVVGYVPEEPKAVCLIAA
ncbi:MAG: hypothetical protein PHF79_01990 [Candidatus Pacebacteria bacterium]|nr:hypothetical protein [Candidatus Paceibacterota bacterium]